MELNVFSLYDLGTLIKRVLSLNFQDKIWVKAEISGCKVVRGIAYLELVEKEEGQSDKIIAQQSAVIWQGTLQKLNGKLSEPITGFLEIGREILVLVQIDFNVRYGLKLVIDDIDPAYTLGKLFQQRQELEKLIFTEKLHEPNKLIPLPLVIQRIAVLSNEQAAGYQDFVHQLTENSMNYAFSLTLFPISLQGNLVEETVLIQLAEILEADTAFDAVLILRGGGSKLDLAGFDSIKICRAISSFPIKIITGIGHEVDETLSDIVAGISLKTPTAVAEYLLYHNQNFETSIQKMVLIINDKTRYKVQQSKLKLLRCQHELSLRPMRVIDRTNTKLQNIQQYLPNLIINRLKKEEVKLSFFQRLIELANISNTLKRGFSITQLLPGNKPLNDGVKPNMEVETIWEKGSFRSIIIDK
ncbi:exodeoxyribonuclease 7 large subunit [Bacteroidota bacterium]|nr:exodeoxyribonuclease 7 large subunit [Bacteroidota bacterium]